MSATTISRVDVLGETVELELHESGAGDPLLVLHGITDFRADQPWVSMLAAQRHVIVPSHPGYGASQRPDWMRSVTDLAHMYLELLEQWDLHGVSLLGHSLGGWIAAEMAVWRPERIGRLVLVNAVGIRVGGPTDRDLADLFVCSADERVRLLFHDQAYADPPAQELEGDELRARMRADEATVLFCWEPYMCNPDLRRRLAAVDVPTLVLWGENDGFAPITYGDAYARSFPDARFTVIPEAGHCPQLEQSELLVDHVDRFIEARDESRA